MIDIAAIVLAGGSTVFQAALSKVTEQFIERYSTQFGKSSNKIGFEPHLHATYERCTKIKTLLSGIEPSEFAKIHSTQRFVINNLPLDHNELTGRFRHDVSHLILTGSGGSGKSMFMRHLWLAMFLVPDGTVPIFVELRHMKDFSTPDVLPYVYHTLTQGRSLITLDQFRDLLQEGAFTLILDGYDEVSLSRREAVQRSILEITERHPRTKIIVSSRPDENFASWTSFRVAKMADLHQNDVVELISRADFEREAKDRLISSIRKSSFFHKHRGFLVNPLLASMMLLAFSKKYDIPDKMHQFYELAFQALYDRHDAYKPGGYEREFRCKIGEGNFRRLLSYLCLASYYEENFSFSRPSLLSYIEKAKSLMAVEHDSADFLHDLVHNVCIIVPEGLDYAFSHRSFQEYFSAYCMAFVTSKNVDKFVQAFARRPNDNVIRLLVDMAPEKFRDLYVVPMAEKYGNKLRVPVTYRKVATFFAESNAQFMIGFHYDKEDKKRRHTIILDRSGEFNDTVNLFYNLGGGNFSQASETGGRSRDAADVAEIYKIMGLSDRSQLVFSASGGKIIVKVIGDSSDSLAEETMALGVKRFRSSRMYEFIEDRLRVASIYAEKALAEGRKTSAAMETVFDF